MTTGRYLIPIVSTNSKFLTDRRYPLPNRSREARHFLRDQTFLICIPCLQHNPTQRDGLTPARASSDHVSTSSSAFLTAFSAQRSRLPGTAISHTSRCDRVIVLFEKRGMVYLYVNHLDYDAAKPVRMAVYAHCDIQCHAQRSMWSCL